MFFFSFKNVTVICKGHLVIDVKLTLDNVTANPTFKAEIVISAVMAIFHTLTVKVGQYAWCV